jgi:membrane fusion protein, copper/silver efflux system
MTDRGHDDRPHGVAPDLGGNRQAPPIGRRPLSAYVIIAAVSLALGAGGALLIARVTGEAGPPDADVPASHQVHADDAGMNGEAPTPPGGHEHPTEATGETVYISPARQQLIGVRTAEVIHRRLEATIRTVGTLAYDETRVTKIHTKIAGWVETLSVDYVGKVVRRGEPLFSVYSPELVSTQTEYLLALKGLAQLQTSQFAETRGAAESLVAASRDRLTLWDISAGQIEELERTREPRRTLTLHSPFDGIVLERNTFAGQYITPEHQAFTIADLSRVWVLGQIFEYELGLVRLGQEAEIEFPYQQATRTLKGRVTYIYPDVDPRTRRVKVRAEFRNPGLQLKPDSYVTVVIRVSAGDQLAIPREAVIDTGVKRYAILAHPHGYFEPQEIAVGEPVDAFYPVVRGLQHGDRVVTSAQFLIDSETNLQAAMQSMVGHGHAMPGEAPRAPPPAAPDQPKPVPAGRESPEPDHSEHDHPAPPAVNHSQHR